MIRPAKHGDIPAIAALFEEMYARSKYKGRDEIDMKLCKSLAMQSIQRHGLQSAGGACVFVIDANGVCGFVIGVLDRVYHVGRKLMASDLFYYASARAQPREAIKLYDAFLAWAASIPGVIEIKSGATDAIGDYSRVENLYRRKGLVQCGVLYERVVG
jgi:hypothetical protein